jgi:dipeptidase
MCDTFIATTAHTQDGTVIFGKNSDREPNEAQEVVILPARDFPAGETVRCTYLEIPQVAHTHAVLLSKPFWMWGAEMGVNEKGVVIGNEAVFTRITYEKGPALTGMDLLRLSLERSATASEALQTIITLLETHNQGGNCGFTHPFYYHNSFLIADFKEAWVLETAGKEWAAEKVQGVRSISNAITITSKWDRSSAGLVQQALDKKWCRSREDFSFAGCYSDVIYTRFSSAKHRQVCTTQSLEAKQGKVTLADAMALLRSHGSEGQGWRPDKAVVGAEVCMHSGFGPVRGSQSVASLIVELKAGAMNIWVTGTSAPCTGIFKPVWLDAGLPWQEPTPQGTFSSECLFWRHERTHREILLDYPTRIQLYAAERDDLESGFRAQVQNGPKDRQTRAQISSSCFREAEAAEERWYELVSNSPISAQNVFYYQSAWKKILNEAQMTTGRII